MNQYLFTSDRLGFRPWRDDDIDNLASLCADEQVMEHFPKPLSREESEDFLQRLQAHQEKHGHCYYAVELKETEEFIGFIGLAYQSYESPCTPAVDIGWRLKVSAWGNGYATEGATRCLEHAFTDLKLEKVISTFTHKNVKSERVMQKIGMTKMGSFLHPKLADYPDMQKCIWYEKSLL